MTREEIDRLAAAIPTIGVEEWKKMRPELKWAHSVEDVINSHLLAIRMTKFLYNSGYRDGKLFANNEGIGDLLRELPLLLPMWWQPSPSATVLSASESYPIDQPIFPPDTEHVGFFAVFREPCLKVVLDGESEPFTAISFSMGLLRNEGDRITWRFTGWVQRGPTCAPVFTTNIKEGESILREPDDEDMKNDPTFLTERVRLISWCGAAMRFLEQKLFVSSDINSSRQFRRRAAKEWNCAVPTVKVVQMRRSQSDRENGTGDAPVEWSHRWMVRGHWRQQWHQRLSTHVPTWILPHIKGPTDKPLKVPVAEVWSVNR